MNLFAVSDLHLGHAENRPVLEFETDHRDDWLILAGDVGESLTHLAQALDALVPRFAQVLWVPGNHELWTTDEAGGPLGGVAKYEALVALARGYGVLTPEDPYPVWPPDAAEEGVVPSSAEGSAIGKGPRILCPLFLLYDYSFRPPGVALGDVRAWAAAEHALCADEQHLSPAPFRDRVAWCQDRVAQTEARLSALPTGSRPVLINHFPMRKDLLFIHRVPRLAPWCGTVATHDWHLRFNAPVVVTGHQHVPRTDWRDGTRFEEVSLGYPREWRRRHAPPDLDDVLREILPGPLASPLRTAARRGDGVSGPITVS
ncbi:metallophosphoesterase [Roseospira marina]|uniref:Metallophosphoesterase n=1 Tax=Roseospira marina TaxID=140057 RepID=A0A5M6IA33_9PROT|nr:metallophosphoesterase [Roseospira marina]KAA5605136.1 metallophosphoesterase [Roseospira marina]MBB4314889.1 putative phosphodiesterase [Roseospira marina]MBB5087889.1 putative phosphodiesterase [Roseospira marina]